MKCSKCGKEIVNIQTASCISGYDENGKHENWICEKCSFEWEKEHSCYPIDYDKKGITNFICKKCGSTEYEIKDKPNGTGIAHGLYCAKCGFWHKWLGKEELKQYKQKERKETNENKAEKSLRWVVNQIPDFKPTTNEEKMLVAIKLYSEAGAEEIRRLETENAELRERLEKAVELPCKVGDKVYGVGFTDCEDSRTTDEKKKRQIFNVCMKMGGNCEKCKYRRPQIEEFVCTHIQLGDCGIEGKSILIVGDRNENYTENNVFTTREAAEARLKELGGRR